MLKKNWTKIDELVSQKETETGVEKKETQAPISLPQSPSVSDQKNKIKPASINPSSQLNARNQKEMFTEFLATSTKESVADKLIEISNMPFEQQPSMSHAEMNMLCEYLKKRTIVIPEYRIKELQSEERVNILKFVFVIQNNILPDPIPGSPKWKNPGLAGNLDEPLKSVLGGLGVKVKYPQKTEEKI